MSADGFVTLFLWALLVMALSSVGAIVWTVVT